MRRTLLEPAQAVARTVSAEAPGRPRIAVEEAAAGPPRGVLGLPAPASEVRRHLFHPRRGWFRRLERRLSNRIATGVYPRIPGLHRIYDAQLTERLTLAEGDVLLSGLPAAFRGLRVLFVSDIHAGPFVSPRVLLETFRRLMTVDADVILLGGDLVTTAFHEFEQSRAAFAALEAPLGVYAVLGNHDHYTDEAERLRDTVERCGIRVLHNTSTRLERDGAELCLAGVDDMLVGRPDLDRALERTEAPVILLSHNPDLAFDAARRSVALMLSGHTHGGQIRVPGLPVLVRQSRYRLDEGRYVTGDMELVVSRGLGTVGLPLRVACPPEAVLLTLR